MFKAPLHDKPLKMKVSLLHVPNWYSVCKNARYSNYKGLYIIYMKFCFVFYFCGKICCCAWSSPCNWRRGLIWTMSLKSLSKWFGGLGSEALFDLPLLQCYASNLIHLFWTQVAFRPHQLAWTIVLISNFFPSNPFFLFSF